MFNKGDKMFNIENKLAFNKALIDVYPHHAFISALLFSNDYNMPKLLNYYVNLVYDQEKNRMDFDIGLNILYYLKNQDMFFSHSISRTMVKNNWKSFNDFVISSINDGYCVHGLINTYHISAYSDYYNKFHFIHNITIYGYDKKKKVFLAADAF